MAKVLFVVYVPSRREEQEDNGETDLDVKTDLKEKSNSQESNEKVPSAIQESDTTTNPEVVDSESFIQDGDIKEVDADSSNEKKEESDLRSEDENCEINADDPSKNAFFKAEEKKEEDCGESLSNVETGDSEPSSKEDDANDNDKKKKEKPAFVRFISESSLVEKVKRVLDDLNVGGVQWSLTEQGVYVGMFVADDGSQCEDVLRKLSMLQIGVIKDSSVCVFPASISSEEKWVEKEIEETKIKEDELSEWVSKFKNSIKSRLVVDQVVNAVNNDAKFTFDYLMLIILASFVALMGLLESSSVVLVASMLISPLMGPILAGVFGVVIRKGELIRVGIINEMRGLTICVLIGFLSGFIPACIETGTKGWRSSTEWPTPEMSSRGALRALPVGILIAIPSGAGVALSILGGKVGSLVGVAISASLLPPAVNAGLLWANAIIAAISPPPVISPPVFNPKLTAESASHLYTSHGLTCEALADNDYDRQYFCSMAKESVMLGCISLLLTILNIFCIILMGVIVLKIKEVAPIPQSIVPESENEFFCKDLKIARESNMTMKGQAAAAIRKDWLKTFKEMKSQCGNDDDEEEEDEHELNNIIDEVEGSPSVINIYDKMLINPPRWSRAVHTPSSVPDNRNKRFDFPSPSPREDAENGIELRQRRTPHHPSSPSSSSSKTPKTASHDEEGEEETNAVYFTVHRYIHPMDLLKGESYARKSGKFIKTLKLPKASRFMIARVAEDPASDDLKSETNSQQQPTRSENNVCIMATVSETSEPESQPLLKSTKTLKTDDE